MATPFSKIYSEFIVQIDDYELSSVSEEEFNQVLQGYILGARLPFMTYGKDLMSVDIEKAEFVSDLTPQEVMIFAKSMTYQWMVEKRNSLELHRKAIGDRDFQATQGYGYLEKITASLSKLRREIKQEITIYEYSQKDLWGELLNG